MATETQSGSSNGFLYFIVGALLIAVIGMGVWMANGGHIGQSSTDRAITRSADAVGDAAKNVGDAAKNATQPN